MKRLLLAIVLLLASSFALAAININTATKEELDALPGIGPVKAQAIIEYRNANGPFKTPEDVMKVKGIKEGEFGKIKGEISVSGATSVPAAAKSSGAMAPAKTATPMAAPAAAKGGSAMAPSVTPAATGSKTATTAPMAAPAKDAGNAKMTKAEEKAKAKEDKAAKAKEEKATRAKETEDKAAKAKEEKLAKAQAKKDKSSAKDKAAKDSPTKADAKGDKPTK